MPDVLFAPWRYEYLVSEKSSVCVFCAAAAEPESDASLVVFRGKRVFVLLNRYPYTNGHLMVAPYAHEAWLSDSSRETREELVAMLAVSERILVETYRTDGLNLGINFGSAAGAGVASHYHVHLVPRWLGDTNFMSVAGQTRVVPETLESTRERLRPIFAERAK
jgi:ATP adenylyltransferase